MAELEKTFDCPVIEAYGMTEASHQMASNPLPPAARLHGSVGIAAGPAMRILGPDGRFRPAGGGGAIVNRGPNDTAGYESNDEDNDGGSAADHDGGRVRRVHTAAPGTKARNSAGA